jgi:5-methylcytosine-specific restriction endonuclease McrA
LTSKGALPVNASGAVPKGEVNEAIALERALQNGLRQSLCPGRRYPTVARLVMQEQQRHWRENPDDYAEYRREWAQVSWWLKYQINPDLRLYHREKSKRRKAQDRGQTPLQVPVKALRQRFNEFSNRCAYCGQEGDMQIEHVEPISKGGAHDIGNIVPACWPCNGSKGTSEMESWYRQQPFFSELRLQAIRRVVRRPEGAQLALALA